MSGNKQFLAIMAAVLESLEQEPLIFTDLSPARAALQELASAPRKRRRSKQRPLTARQREIAECVARHDFVYSAAAKELRLSRSYVTRQYEAAKEKLLGQVRFDAEHFDAETDTFDEVGGGVNDKKPVPLDPEVIDLGERRDRRTKRQRSKGDE